MLSAKENCLIETVLLSTHNIYYLLTDMIFICCVLVIDYNRKLFIYMQSIDDWMEFWESIISEKSSSKRIYFLVNTKCKFLFGFSHKVTWLTFPYTLATI